MMLLHEVRDRRARKMSVLSDDSAGSGVDGADVNPLSGAAGGDTGADTGDGEPEGSRLWVNIWKCEDLYEDISAPLGDLWKGLVRMRALLPLAPVEPQIFKGEFRVKVYAAAVQCFSNLLRSGRAMNGAISAMCNVLTRLHSRDVVKCLGHVGYIIRQVVLVSEQGERALLKAESVLQRYSNCWKVVCYCCTQCTALYYSGMCNGMESEMRIQPYVNLKTGFLQRMPAQHRVDPFTSFKADRLLLMRCSL